MNLHECLSAVELRAHSGGGENITSILMAMDRCSKKCRQARLEPAFVALKQNGVVNIYRHRCARVPPEGKKIRRSRATRSWPFEDGSSTDLLGLVNLGCHGPNRDAVPDPSGFPSGKIDVHLFCGSLNACYGCCRSLKNEALFRFIFRKIRSWRYPIKKSTE